MRILGIIPARGGSKGVPGKNIKLLNGIPLLQYTSNVALASKKLSKVVLSSDSDEIIKIGKQLGLEVPFKRPGDLAKDTSPTLPVIQHALNYYASIGENFDAVCLLQVTSPFRTVEFLDSALEQFSIEKTDSLISVQEVPKAYNPHWTFIENEHKELEIATGASEIISRRQDLPIAYHRDGSIYVTKTNIIMNQGSLYGKSIGFAKSPKSSSINIDTIEDWEKAENWINSDKS